MAAQTQFSTVEVSKLAKEMKVRLDVFVREFAMDLSEEALKRTPVDTGNLRANWTAYKNFLPDGRSAVRLETSGRQAGASKFPPVSPLLISQVNTVANNLDAGDEFFFVNNAEYAAAVEFGRSDQPNRVPAGMVRNTVAMAPQIADQTAKRIKRLRERFGT